MPRKRRNAKKFFLFCSFFILLLVIIFFCFQKFPIADILSNVDILSKVGKSKLSFDLGISFDLFKVKRVVCFEEEFPCQPERLKIFEQVYDKNIFLLKSSSLSEKVKETYPEILRLEVAKQLPGTLKIKIIKRTPAVYLTYNEKDYFLSDDRGVIFQGPLTESEYSQDLPLIIFSPETLELEKGLDLTNYGSFQKALYLQELLQQFFINFSELKIENEGDLTLTLTETVVATFSAKKNLKIQVASLQLILKQSKMEEPFLEDEEGRFIRKIDLRFEKPVIKF